MEITNCKVVDGAVGKVVVQLVAYGVFDRKHKLTVQSIGFYSYESTELKGDYFLLKKLFDVFDTKDADDFMNRESKRKNYNG